MKKLIYLLIIIFPLFSKAQSNSELTNEERAYLYNTVKNSPILDKYLGNYFRYIGPKIIFPNKEINYDSLGTYLTFYPDSLKIYNQEIAKAPKGLITEAINKMVLWELNRMLMAKRGTEFELEPYKNEYSYFESIFVKYLPPSAVKSINGILSANPKLDNILNPMLSFDDKCIQLSSFQFLTQNDQLVTINAITKTINEYVSTRTKEKYIAIGGIFDSFENINIGAGDGTISSPEFIDRESNEKSKWVMGLPKTVGLIPFQAKYTEGSGAIRSKIDPLTFSTNDFITSGQNKYTNVHLDVWGYNPEKQVTIIIEKNGLCYPLFNDGKSRFLSPDSSFSIKGGTFKSKMDVLEFKKIKDLNNNIYGKKGFDYWIAYNNKMKDKVELQIVKLEKKYSDYGYNPIGIQKKKTKAKKVKRRKNDRDRLENYQISGNKQDLDKKKTQVEIVRLHGIFDEYKRIIKELEIEKKQAIDLLALYNRRLDDYKLAFGQKWAKYKEKDGFYIFEDSSTFNILTQEFNFPPKYSNEQFEVRNLAIPEDCLSNNYDEVMVHMNIIDEIPFYDTKINKQFRNEFSTIKWDFDSKIFNNYDSIALSEIFHSLTHDKKKLIFNINANGIGNWNGSRVVKNEFIKTKISNGKFDEKEEELLNTTELIIDNKTNMLIEINSFTNHQKFDIEILNEKVKNLETTQNLTKNEIITLYRSTVLLSKLKNELIELSKNNLSVEESKMIIKKINSSWKKIIIHVGNSKIKYSEVIQNLN